MSQAATKTVYRACTLCEAHCGLTVEVEDNRAVRVRGDEEDEVETLVGQSTLNGIRVELAAMEKQQSAVA